jgi:hypothetical protein
MRIAVIHAFGESAASGDETSVRGCGRKDGTAACRALLNLLRNRQFRQRKVVSVHLSLVITNIPKPTKHLRVGGSRRLFMSSSDSAQKPRTP